MIQETNKFNWSSCYIFSCSSCCGLCFQADGELYLHRQMEKTIVKLLKVKMPDLIRLNSAARGGNDVQLHFGFCFAHWCQAGTVLETPPT